MTQLSGRMRLIEKGLLGLPWDLFTAWHGQAPYLLEDLQCGAIMGLNWRDKDRAPSQLSKGLMLMTYELTFHLSFATLGSMRGGIGAAPF